MASRDELYDYLRQKSDSEKRLEDASKVRDAGAILNSLSHAASMAGSLGGQTSMDERDNSIAKVGETLYQSKKDQIAADDADLDRRMKLRTMLAKRSESKKKGAIVPGYSKPGYILRDTPEGIVEEPLPSGFTPNKPKASPKPPPAPKQNQFEAAGFGKRIEQAENEFADLERGGYDRTDAVTSANAGMWNLLQTGENQRQNQAEKNFITAVLRRESGASISPTEFSTAEKQYFPRAGDTPETIKQKKRNRDQVLAALKAEAGPAWDSVGNEIPSEEVRVRNPQTGEEFDIPREDLEDAEQDGFEVVNE